MSLHQVGNYMSSLKIKSVIDDGCLTMTFTKEHGEQEGETNETL